MSKTSYSFSTIDYEVTFVHQKKKYPKQQYFTEYIRIICQPHSPSQPKFKALLDSDTKFRYFEDLQELIKYIRAKRNQNIVELNQTGFVSIFVKGKDGSKEIQNINIDRVDHKPDIVESSIFYDKFQDDVVKDFQKMVRDVKKQIPKVSPKVIAEEKKNESIVFVFNMSEHQINNESPTQEFRIPKQVMLCQGFKLVVSKMCAQRLVLGIRYKDGRKASEFRYWCSYKAICVNDQLRVSANHKLEIYIEDDGVVIMNANNKNGRFFTDSRFDELVGEECIVFISLDAPKM